MYIYIGTNPPKTFCHFGSSQQKALGDFLLVLPLQAFVSLCQREASFAGCAKMADGGRYSPRSP